MDGPVTITLKTPHPGFQIEPEMEIVSDVGPVIGELMLGFIEVDLSPYNKWPAFAETDASIVNYFQALARNYNLAGQAHLELILHHLMLKTGIINPGYIWRKNKLVFPGTIRRRNNNDLLRIPYLYHLHYDNWGFGFIELSSLRKCRLVCLNPDSKIQERMQREENEIRSRFFESRDRSPGIAGWYKA